jgi:hypothetical protein
MSLRLLAENALYGKLGRVIRTLDKEELLMRHSETGRHDRQSARIARCPIFERTLEEIKGRYVDLDLNFGEGELLSSMSLLIFSGSHWFKGGVVTLKE